MGAREEPGEPVMVPAGVLEGLEAARRSGAHMVERTHVLVLAKRIDYRQTVRWVLEARAYAETAFLDLHLVLFGLAPRVPFTVCISPARPPQPPE